MSRPGLPAIALTTDTSFLTAYPNDFGFDGVFARQVQALGSRGDVLITISTSGASPNVLAAVDEAKRVGLSIVALLGEAGPLAASRGRGDPRADARHASDPAGSSRGRTLDLPSCGADALSMTLTIAFVQLNPTVGDVAGNTALVRRMRDEAAAQGADLVVFSELVLVGYPPEDLVLRPALVEAAAARAARTGAREHRRPARRDSWSRCRGERMAGCTTPWRSSRTDTPSCASSTSCPNYGVFDEKRVFAPGPLPEPVVFRDVANRPSRSAKTSGSTDVTTHLAQARRAAAARPQRLAVRGRQVRASTRAGARARVPKPALPLAYVNQVGGQDELVFDGGSFVMNADGSLAC